MNPTNGAWPAGWPPFLASLCRLFWVGLFLLACFTTVQVFITFLRPERKVVNYQPKKLLVLDFFQEWASARNYFEGLPVYTRHQITMARYLKITKTEGVLIVKINAHPPTSILLALPFGLMDYGDAFLLWNLLCLLCFVGSLWLIIWQGEVAFSPWSLFPLFIL